MHLCVCVFHMVTGTRARALRSLDYKAQRMRAHSRTHTKNQTNMHVWCVTASQRRQINLHATLMSVVAYADAARGRCVTSASSPKYWPLFSTEISTSPSSPSCSSRMDTLPSSMKYMPSAASPAQHIHAHTHPQTVQHVQHVVSNTM